MSRAGAGRGLLTYRAEAGKLEGEEWVGGQ